MSRLMTIEPELLTPFFGRALLQPEIGEGLITEAAIEITAISKYWDQNLHVGFSVRNTSIYQETEEPAPATFSLEVAFGYYSYLKWTNAVDPVYIHGEKFTEGELKSFGVDFTMPRREAGWFRIQVAVCEGPTWDASKRIGFFRSQSQTVHILERIRLERMKWITGTLY